MYDYISEVGMTGITVSSCTANTSAIFSLAQSGSATQGGAFLFTNTTSLNILNSTISDCTSSDTAGALEIYGVPTASFNAVIFDSNAAANAGGAVGADTSNDVTFTNCVFSNNYNFGSTNAIPHGGALYANDILMLQIKDTLFTGNLAGPDSLTPYSGAVDISVINVNTNLTVDSCRFEYNQVSRGGEQPHCSCG
jgi:filamentous hemagglutinin family protein